MSLFAGGVSAQSRFEVSQYSFIERYDGGSKLEDIFRCMSECLTVLKRHWKVFRCSHPEDFPLGVHSYDRIYAWSDCDDQSKSARWHLRLYGRPLLGGPAAPLAADALVRSFTDIAVSDNFADLLNMMNYHFDYEYVQDGFSWVIQKHLDGLPHPASTLSSSAPPSSSSPSVFDPFLQVQFYSILKLSRAGDPSSGSSLVSSSSGSGGAASAAAGMEEADEADEGRLVELRASVRSEEHFGALQPMLAKIHELMEEFIEFEGVPTDLRPT